MIQPHVQVRNALLDDHVKKGWMDADMFLAYCLMLRNCDWATGVWIGSADALAALSGGQWSKPTAVRILRRLRLGRYITSHHVDKVRGNYDIAINNFIPTIGENIGKELRPTRTRDYRIGIASDSDKWATDQDRQRPCTESRVIRNQDCNLTPPSESGVGVGSGEARSAARTSRIANAIADARPVVVYDENRKANPNPKTSSEPEVRVSEFEAPVQDVQAPPVSQEDPSPSSAAPLPEVSLEEFQAYLEDDATYLANYLWMFLIARPDVEIIPPWEKFWIQDFKSALDEGHTKEDIELAILCSQTGASKKYYIRAKSICDNLDLLIEKGQKLLERGVLREHECKCHGLFAMLGDLQEHQETCEIAQAIDPEDAAEEEAMYAAEDAVGRGQMTDITEMTDPFAGEREDESWK